MDVRMHKLPVFPRHVRFDKCIVRATLRTNALRHSSTAFTIWAAPPTSPSLSLSLSLSLVSYQTLYVYLTRALASRKNIVEGLNLVFRWKWFKKEIGRIFGDLWRKINFGVSLVANWKRRKILDEIFLFYFGSKKFMEFISLLNCIQKIILGTLAG